MLNAFISLTNILSHVFDNFLDYLQICINTYFIEFYCKYHLYIHLNHYIVFIYTSTSVYSALLFNFQFFLY